MSVNSSAWPYAVGPTEERDSSTKPGNNTSGPEILTGNRILNRGKEQSSPAGYQSRSGRFGDGILRLVGGTLVNLGRLRVAHGDCVVRRDWTLGHPGER